MQARSALSDFGHRICLYKLQHVTGHEQTRLKLQLSVRLCACQTVIPMFRFHTICASWSIHNTYSFELGAFAREQDIKRPCTIQRDGGAY